MEKTWIEEGEGLRRLQTTNTTADGPSDPNDGQVLLNTLILYGTIFIIIWPLFCWLRLKYPLIYNVRGYAKDIKCKLAKNQYSMWSWLFEVYEIPEKQIMDQCGFDSLCLVRMLKWCVKISAIGAFNALWLIPVYGSSKESEETAHIEDYIASITLSNVPPGSARLIATVIGAYVFFGGALYLLHDEFENWFLSMRFRFLAQPKAKNYSVYIHGIQQEYKADYDIAEYFQESFGLGRVQEAHLKLQTPELLKLTMNRTAIVAKLEHAINVFEVEGKVPTHKDPVHKVVVDSIEVYGDELRNINIEITERIEFLEMGGYDSDDDDTKEDVDDQRPGDQGEPMDGAFLTFYNLSSAQAAKQMNHARGPFEMQVLEAPDPDDVLWANVGKNQRQIQIGKHVSLFLTVAICLLWTIPIAFFSSLSSIEGLEEQFPAIKEANEKNPWLRQVLAQVAPFLVVIVNILPPIILKILSTMECHISHGMVQASLFSKLAAFAVIQTFFVSAISGSVVKELSNMIEDPTKIISLLANALPTQSTFFIQYVFIVTVLGVGIELLRVGPVVMASLRGCLGPNLTEKERNTPWLFFSPLSCPSLFNHAAILATVVLFLMILFVYTVIAPLTSIVLVLSFLLLGSAYRHQLIYIYPPAQESGGRLWMRFVGIILNCMLVAQVTIMGILGLKESVVAVVLIVPLLIATGLFKSYLQQRHFRAAECLPSRECYRRDASSDFYITESFEDLYVQPELLTKEVLPENIGSKLRKKISTVQRKKKKKKSKRKRRDKSVGKSHKTEPIMATEELEAIDDDVQPPPSPPSSV